MTEWLCTWLLTSDYVGSIPTAPTYLLYLISLDRTTIMNNVVKFLNKGGYQNEAANAVKHGGLEPDKEYEVKEIILYGFISDYVLKGLEGKTFNTCMFSRSWIDLYKSGVELEDKTRSLPRNYDGR